MADEPRWRRDERLPFQDVQGMTVVVVPSRRELHRLEESAPFLWSALQRPKTVVQLAEALCEEFDVDAATAEKDVREFLASLEEKGLVVRA